jgi:hypothetical protein
MATKSKLKGGERKKISTKRTNKIMKMTYPIMSGCLFDEDERSTSGRAKTMNVVHGQGTEKKVPFFVFNVF